MITHLSFVKLIFILLFNSPKKTTTEFKNVRDGVCGVAFGTAKDRQWEIRAIKQEQQYSRTSHIQIVLNFYYKLIHFLRGTYWNEEEEEKNDTTQREIGS